MYHDKYETQLHKLLFFYSLNISGLLLKPAAVPTVCLFGGGRTRRIIFVV